MGITLHPPITPVITVVDADGKPLEGAGVELMQRARHSTFEGGEPVETDAQGRATLRPLDPLGTYTLEVRVPANRTELAPLKLSAWLPGDATLELPLTAKNR